MLLVLTINCRCFLSPGNKTRAEAMLDTFKLLQHRYQCLEAMFKVHTQWYGIPIQFSMVQPL